MEIVLRFFQLSVEITSVLLSVPLFIFLKGFRAWNTGNGFIYILNLAKTILIQGSP